MSSGKEKFSVVFWKTGVSWLKWQRAADCSTCAQLQLGPNARSPMFAVPWSFDGFDVSMSASRSIMCCIAADAESGARIANRSHHQHHHIIWWHVACQSADSCLRSSAHLGVAGLPRPPSTNCKSRSVNKVTHKFVKYVSAFCSINLHCVEKRTTVPL